MSEKYTPAIALAIKRDVQKAQETLIAINRAIEEKQIEKSGLDVILDEKRSLVARFEDMMLGVFSYGLKRKSEQQKQLEKISDTISKLEVAKSLIEAEISQRKEEIPPTDGSVLMQSLIQELQPVLDKLLQQIEVSESEIKTLENKKVVLRQATQKLANEARNQEKRVVTAKSRLEKANREREAALQELSREQQQLNEIRNRERDSKVMSQRLSEEYIKVYATLPSRNRK